jgi:hypothetical protein
MSGRASSMSSRFFIFSRQKLSSVQSGCATRFNRNRYAPAKWHREHRVIRFSSESFPPWRPALFSFVDPVRYRPTVDSDFSVLVVLHRKGRLDTFKYRGPELICEACGADFQTAMIHTSAGGLAIDEPWTTEIGPSG